MHLDFGWGKFPQKVIDAVRLKQLAADGKSRREISDAMGRPYKQFWKTVKNSDSLTIAFNEGEVMFKAKQKN